MNRSRECRSEFCFLCLIAIKPISKDISGIKTAVVTIIFIEVVTIISVLQLKELEIREFG